MIERLSNPFLDHRLAEIFTNHEAKKQRRFGGLIDLAKANGVNIKLPRLKAALADGRQMARDPLASGDLIAERRFAYAKAAAEDGDWSTGGGAIRAGARARAELAGGVVRAWRSAAKLGDLDAAAQAFRMSLVADPADAQGASARLALMGREKPPDALPQAYVTRLFDDYAPRFDAHLTENLRYRAPALIAEALTAVAPAALRLGPRPRLRNRTHGGGAARACRPPRRRRPLGGHDREGARA